jgi:hypothetical protein
MFKASVGVRCRASARSTRSSPMEYLFGKRHRSPLLSTPQTFLARRPPRSAPLACPCSKKPRLPDSTQCVRRRGVMIHAGGPQARPGGALGFVVPRGGNVGHWMPERTSSVLSEQAVPNPGSTSRGPVPVRGRSRRSRSRTSPARRTLSARWSLGEGRRSCSKPTADFPRGRTGRST